MVSVEIYIKVPVVNNTTTSLTSDTTSFSADGSVIKADATTTTINVQGETYARLDLFKDEKISLTSSIQNVNDLSKVFTDYSQSFTVPASKVNNKIFNYWNESGVNDGFDQRARYDAIIEINTLPFKKGQIQIEKANEKNNRVESFSVTFYGKVKQIKDLFKEDKLAVLDYSSLNHPFTFDYIAGRIDGSINDDVAYPLIGNEHKYEYLTGGTYDVTVGGSNDKSINYTDLFPAVSVNKIFEFIQSAYGITFTSTLFNTSYWKNLYLLFKNADRVVNYTPPVLVNWTSKDGVYPTFDLFPELNLANDTIAITWTYYYGFTQFAVANYQKITLNITPTNSTIPYKVKVRIYDSPNYSQGAIYNIYDNLLGTQNLVIFSEYPFAQATVGKFKFEVESETSLIYTSQIQVLKTGNSSPSVTRLGYATSMSTSSDVNINSHCPDMKIVDFFNGIIKLFNLTITATSETEFNLEPLEFYYAYGDYIDINSYVINDSVDLERTKLFKKLTFTHEKSENILNNYFRNTFQRGYDYGDLIWDNNLSNESTTYEIKSPFEDVMWEKATAGDFITTTLIDKDLKPYKNKPMLMYKSNAGGTTTHLTTPFKMYNDQASFYVNFSDYVRFSNELNLNGSIASLNFGEEQSSFILNNLASDSLFKLWYQNYISGLYDIRCRIVKLKAIMPITQLSTLKLNDKIIYKDKKYIINQFTTDLTSGEVDFELISDFRAVTNSAGGTDRFALKQDFVIDNTAQDLEVTILKLNSEYYDVRYYATSYDSSGNYSDDTFIVPIDANTTGSDVLKTIEITYHNPDDKQYINIIQYA